MARLTSTKAILNGKIQTSINLLLRADSQITNDYHKLNIMRGALYRTKRQKTLKATHKRLTDLATEMGHALPTSEKKTYMLNKISVYKRQNSFLRYAAIQQAIINICVVYEDFIHKVILKYYEEDIRRIPSNKDSMKNKYLISAILRGDNIHRTLAEKVVDDLMYGSVEGWYKTLKDCGMNLSPPNKLVELFLIRNCIVHNNNRVSSRLNLFLAKYKLRHTVRLSTKDVEDFKNEVHKAAAGIIAEYSRLFPANGGTWL